MKMLYVDEEHVSPDGRLRLLVEHDDGGDIIIGFAGVDSHTDGNVLGALSGLDTADAVGAYVDEILSDRALIAVATVKGEIRNICVVDDLSSVDRYKPADEQIELRRWSGVRSA
jgi:hypothetical protein